MNIFAPPNKTPAQVAELVDALDSKSSSFESAGSIPALGTKQNENQSESEDSHSCFTSFSLSHSLSSKYQTTKATQSSQRHFF